MNALLLIAILAVVVVGATGVAALMQQPAEAYVSAAVPQTNNSANYSNSSSNSAGASGINKLPDMVGGC